MPSYDYGGNASGSYWRRCGGGAGGVGVGSKERNTGPGLLPFPPPSSSSYVVRTNSTLDQSFPSSSSRDYGSSLPPRSYDDSGLGLRSRHSLESGYDRGGPSSLQFGDDSRLSRSGYDNSSLPPRSHYEDLLRTRTLDSARSSRDSRPQYREELTSDIVTRMLDAGYGRAGFNGSSSSGGNYRDEMLGYPPEVSAAASGMRSGGGGGGGGGGYNSTRIPGLLDLEERRSRQDYPMQDSFGGSSRMSRGDGLLGMPPPERERLDMGGSMRRTAADFMGGGGGRGGYGGGQRMDNRDSKMSRNILNTVFTSDVGHHRGDMGPGGMSSSAGLLHPPPPPLLLPTSRDGRQAWDFRKTISDPRSRRQRPSNTNSNNNNKNTGPAAKKPKIDTQSNEKTTTDGDKKKAAKGDDDDTQQHTSKTDSGDKEDSIKRTEATADQYNGIPPSDLCCRVCDRQDFQTVKGYLRHLEAPRHAKMCKAFNAVESSVMELLQSEAKLASVRELDAPLDSTQKCPECEVYMNVPNHNKTLEHFLVKGYKNPRCCLTVPFETRTAMEEHRLTPTHYRFVSKRKLKGQKMEEEQAKKQRVEDEAVAMIKKAHDDLENVADEDKVTSRNLPPYDPEVPVGIESIRLNSFAYKCDICPERKHLQSEDLIKRHFHSFPHYSNLCDYMEELEEPKTEAVVKEKTTTNTKEEQEEDKKKEEEEEIVEKEGEEEEEEEEEEVEEEEEGKEEELEEEEEEIEAKEEYEEEQETSEIMEDVEEFDNEEEQQQQEEEEEKIEEEKQEVKEVNGESTRREKKKKKEKKETTTTTTTTTKRGVKKQPPPPPPPLLPQPKRTTRSSRSSRTQPTPAVTAKTPAQPAVAKQQQQQQTPQPATTTTTGAKPKKKQTTTTTTATATTPSKPRAKRNNNNST